MSGLSIARPLRKASCCTRFERVTPGSPIYPCTSMPSGASCLISKALPEFGADEVSYPLESVLHRGKAKTSRPSLVRTNPIRGWANAWTRTWCSMWLNSVFSVRGNFRRAGTL